VTGKSERLKFEEKKGHPNWMPKNDFVIKVAETTNNFAN
jgi:hypothetical protein